MGNTPIVELQKKIHTKVADVYVKLEEFNPGISIKAHIALQMVIESQEYSRSKDTYLIRYCYHQEIQNLLYHME